VKRNSIHGDMFHLTVKKTVAFAEEIDAVLDVGDDRNHSVGTADDPVDPQTADQEAGLTGRQILR
jgi:hypothetical protein